MKYTKVAYICRAMYMNSCFNQEHLDKNFEYWDRECFENCVDNRLKDVQLEKMREHKAAMRAISPKLKIWVAETNFWHNLRADIAELRRQVGPKANGGNE